MSFLINKYLYLALLNMALAISFMFSWVLYRFPIYEFPLEIFSVIEICIVIFPAAVVFYGLKKIVQPTKLGNHYFPYVLIFLGNLINLTRVGRHIYLRHFPADGEAIEDMLDKVNNVFNIDACIYLLSLFTGPLVLVGLLMIYITYRRKAK